MNPKKVKRVLQKIARKEGVSEDMVRHDIELAIDAAEENPDPKVQAFWHSVPHDGAKPTPEEVIAHIGKIMKECKKNKQ